MSAKHTDLAGTEITVGSYVVYAALWDRSAVLKYGIVSALKERDDWAYSRTHGKSEQVKRPTIGVITVDRTWNWKDDANKYVWELQNDGKEITLGFTDRCLVVTPYAVPHEAADLLLSAYHDKMAKKKGASK